MKPLPAPIVNAATRLRAQAHKSGCLPMSKLCELVQSNPFAHWSDYAEFHLREVIDWGDGGKPSVNFIASFKGCENAYDRACRMFVMEAALDQSRVKIEKKIGYTYSLLLSVGNKVNGLKAWLNCETGVLETGPNWIKDAEAFAASKESGVAA